MKLTPGSGLVLALSILLGFAPRPAAALEAGAPSQPPRVALVIGNAAYAPGRLKTPVNDATSMKAALEGCRFQVTLLTDAPKAAMEDAIRSFCGQLRGGAVGLFYFAGHGLQLAGDDYLFPVGTRPAPEEALIAQGVDLGLVVKGMDAAKNPANILILDACRPNPFAPGADPEARAKGLSKFCIANRTFTVLAAQPNQEVADGDGEHSVYTQALLAEIQVPRLELADLLERVRARVSQATGGRQVPWDDCELEGDFYFKPATGLLALEGGKARPAAPQADDPGLPGAVKNPQGLWEIDLDLGPCRMRMVRIPAGTFLMGVKGGEAYERQHQVTLSRPFWLGKHPVTQGQWRAILGRKRYRVAKDPSDFKGEDRPVEGVSWDAAQVFIAALNGAVGGGCLRLPTEAEWEYACRGGSKAEQCPNLDAVAWHAGNSGQTTHPVGLKEPNGFGLHDMLGNVDQWCQDWLGDYSDGPVVDPQGAASGERKAVRGGCWEDDPESVRWTARLSAEPGRLTNMGFRLAMMLP